MSKHLTQQEDNPYLNQVYLVDKALKWTSFDVVKKLRNLFRVKKIGHAGTLDPLATGLLILCTGKMTKQIEQFMGQEKEYLGQMILGKTTPSFDLETEVDSETDISHITEDMILQATHEFLGTIMQEPPLFSAININGERAYHKARKGEQVKLQPREVSLKVFEIEKIELPEVTFRIVCSKGFYVRSLVRDFGKSLNVGAYMSSLRRTRIGDFCVENAKSVEDIQREVLAAKNENL